MEYLRKLSLGALAVAALVASIGTSAVLAAEFHSSAGGAIVTGKQSESHIFKIQGQSITCPVVNYSGFAPATGTSVNQDLQAEYTGCTIVGSLGASVNMSGCWYRFNVFWSANPAEVELKSCTLGGITITVSNILATCHLKIPTQAGINGHSIENIAGGDLRIKINSNSIDYEVTKSSGVCPFTVGAGTNGVYTGTAVISAPFANLEVK